MELAKKTIWIVVFLFAVSCRPNEQAPYPSEQGGQTMPFKLTSPAFADGQMIPSKYTADGDNVSPPLAWEGLPPGTQSLALICDDPDAPVGTWVHWLMWNIPATPPSLREHVPPQKQLPNGSRQGVNDFGRIGYGGPAPPSGTHRYYFRLYALDTVLDLPAGASRGQLEKAMKGHILGQTQLMGKYSRQR